MLGGICIVFTLNMHFYISCLFKKVNLVDCKQLRAKLFRQIVSYSISHKLKSFSDAGRCCLSSRLFKKCGRTSTGHPADVCVWTTLTLQQCLYLCAKDCRDACTFDRAHTLAIPVVWLFLIQETAVINLIPSILHHCKQHTLNETF